MADVAQTLTKSVALMQDSEVTCEDNAAFNTALTSALQELSLRITQLGSSACNTVSVSGVDLQERRQLAQKSRQLLQEATLRLKENHVDAGLLNALKGCLVALRSSEHMAAQQLVQCVHPVLQTLSILEKSSTSDRLTLNVKLLGMRLTKFLELSGRKLHDLRGPQRRARLQTQAYIVTKVFPSLVNSMENALQRPNNVYDRAAKHLFFNVVKQSTESMVKLFTSPISEELEDDSSTGKLVKTIDHLLDEIDNLEVGSAATGFETIQEGAEWLVSFAMSVAKAVKSNGTDEKDVINGCHHLVNELGNLKEAFNGDNVADLTLAKEVAKDFIEVTEQSVNSALLRLIVLSLSQLHVPLDRLIHAVLSSDKVLPNRTQEDIHDLIEASDTHADRLFHIAHFAVFCTSDADTAQSLTNSLHLIQILEKELVPACLKVYFNPEDTGARSYLKTLRQHWKSELDMLETYILDIVDPTAFCVIVEAEARRIAAQVKKDQYSQSRDFLRLSVSQVVRLCQMAVDFAWKEMSSEDEEENRPNPRLPEDHPIIRVERSTWEVQAALKMVIANVEDLRHHKVLIRRVQLMVTCATAMVECLMEPEGHRSTDQLTGSRVKVLTSVSRINIGEANKTTAEVEESKKSGGRILSKSFKNITMNNTIGVSRKNSMQLKAFAMSFNGGRDASNLTFKLDIRSRKASAELEKVAELEMENTAKKELHRKVKLHSTSEGFRSPLKQISNQLATSGTAAAASNSQQGTANLKSTY